MNIVFKFIALAFFTEIIALQNKFLAAMVYSIWLVILLVLLPRMNLEEEIRDFGIAFSSLIALRIMQFLAPMEMIAANWRILVFYILLFAVSIMHIRYCNIWRSRLLNFKGASHLIFLIPMALIAGLLIRAVSHGGQLPFFYANMAIIIFASYAQTLFMFDILQRKLEYQYGLVSIAIIALIPSIFMLNNLGVAMIVFLVNFGIAYRFYKTENIMMALIPTIIINMLNFINFS
jgi:hypothetical protein